MCPQHTRLDFSLLQLPFTSIPIFGVRAHDTHHAIPNSNYGQYIMLWDYVMGTFRLHPQDPGSRESLRDEGVRDAAGAQRDASGAADAAALADVPAVTAGGGLRRR